MNVKSPDGYEKYYLWIMLAAVFISFFYGIWNVPLFDLDEGAFSEATREMVASGNYVTTYLNGDLRFDKPILIYWLQAACVHLFGVTELAFRLPSAIASAIWALGIYFFTARFYDKKTAFTASFIMVTTVTITYVGKLAIADALLNMFITASMFLIYGYSESRKRRYIYLTHIFIGLGVLTKGPVAILIPFCVSFIYFLTKKRLGEWAKCVFNPVGLLLFVAVAAPWYVMEYLDQGQAFIDGFLFKHNLQRFNDSLEAHSGSVFYYVPVVIIGIMPYTGLFISVLVNIRNYLKEGLFLYMLIWFFFVFIFFSFAGTKLPHYMTYGYTPLFILMADQMINIRNYRIHVIPIVLFTSFFLYLPKLMDMAAPKINDEFYQIIAHSFAAEMDKVYMYSIAVCLGLLCLIIISRFGRYTMLVAIGFVTLFMMNVIVTPKIGKVMQLPVKEAALLAKEKGWQVNLQSSANPSFYVYYQNTVKRHAPRPGDILFIRDDKLKKIKYPYDIVYERKGFKLIKIWEK